jgi:hypothetical protein
MTTPSKDLWRDIVGVIEEARALVVRTAEADDQIMMLSRSTVIAERRAAELERELWLERMFNLVLLGQLLARTQGEAGDTHLEAQAAKVSLEASVKYLENRPDHIKFDDDLESSVVAVARWVGGGYWGTIDWGETELEDIYPF